MDPDLADGPQLAPRPPHEADGVLVAHHRLLHEGAALLFDDHGGRGARVLGGRAAGGATNVTSSSPRSRDSARASVVASSIGTTSSVASVAHRSRTQATKPT